MAGQLSLSGNSRYQLRQNSTINVTPFVDIMLVLLIIFMVAMPPATTSIDLKLPPPKPQAGKIEVPTVISVEAGAIFIGTRATTMAGLSSDLAAALDRPDPTSERIYVKADRTVRYERFMEVINALHRNGYLRVGLVNEELKMP